MKNAWGFEIPAIPDILCRTDLSPLIAGIVGRILRAINQASLEDEVNALLIKEGRHRSTAELELLLHEKIVAGPGHRETVRGGMHERARIIASQVEKYLLGSSLADVGCGHGLVSWRVKRHFDEILLLDVVDYRDPDVTLPYKHYSPDMPPPFGGVFDCTFLITVLHHASNPLDLLTEVWKHTGNRLIVIESIFGIEAKTDSPLRHLDEEIQLFYAVFCDWFYNRVLNQGVPVPYNFNTPGNWRRVFSQLPATVAFEEDLGIDLNIVPEHHFMFVLDKEGPLQ